MKHFILMVVVGTGLLAGCQSGPAPADFSNKPPTPEKSFINEMRQKYHGDASKLTAEERSKMDGITHGHTELAMQVPDKK